jgi:hypothetical protein
VIGILTQSRGCVITFAPHTTQVFHILDLTLFGVLERWPRYELPFDDDNVTVKVMTKVYHVFTETIARRNVYGAFRALGIEFDMRKEPYELLFDEVKSRESAGCEELCSTTFPWTGYRVDRVFLGSVASTSLNKST